MNTTIVNTFCGPDVSWVGLGKLVVVVVVVGSTVLLSLVLCFLGCVKWSHQTFLWQAGCTLCCLASTI